MSQMVTVVSFAKHIESKLEALGARGKGLREKLDSMQHEIDEDLVVAIRRVATVRNKILHDSSYANVPDFDNFVASCIDCVVRLEAYLCPKKEIRPAIKAVVIPEVTQARIIGPVVVPEVTQARIIGRVVVPEVKRSRIVGPVVVPEEDLTKK